MCTDISVYNIDYVSLGRKRYIKIILTTFNLGFSVCFGFKNSLRRWTRDNCIWSAQLIRKLSLWCLWNEIKQLNQINRNHTSDHGG